MAVFTHNQFDDTTIKLDENSYDHCRFYRSTLVYAGGLPPSITNCTFVNCRFVLDGAASNTVQWLATLYAQGGYFKEMVEKAIGISADEKLSKHDEHEHETD